MTTHADDPRTTPAFTTPVDRAEELRGKPGEVRFLELPERTCVVIRHGVR